MYKHLNQATDCSVTYILSSSLDKYTFIIISKASFNFGILRHLEVPGWDVTWVHSPRSISPLFLPLSPFHKAVSHASLWAHQFQASSTALQTAILQWPLQAKSPSSNIHPWTKDRGLCSFWYGYWATCAEKNRVLDMRSMISKGRASPLNPLEPYSSGEIGRRWRPEWGSLKYRESPLAHV